MLILISFLSQNYFFFYLFLLLSRTFFLFFHSFLISLVFFLYFLFSSHLNSYDRDDESCFTLIHGSST
ncbi:hypothetical protein S245_011031, partial [Arachis hypogaea]